MGDIGLKLTVVQEVHIERVLETLAKSEIALAKCLDLADMDLELAAKATMQKPRHTPIVKTGKRHALDVSFAANSNVPEASRISQQEWVSHHENLMDEFDSYAMSICYLLKIRHSMPHLIKKYGTHYNYSIAFDDKAYQNSINLLNFYHNDGRPAVDDLWQNCKTVYESIAQIQEYLNEENHNAIREAKLHKPFTERFCQNRLPNIGDNLARMEFLFFQEYGIPLAIFADASANVLKWIQRQTFDNVTRRPSTERSLHFRHLNKFPGIVCHHVRDGLPLTATEQYRLATGLLRAVAPEGLLIGDGFKQPHPRPAT